MGKASKITITGEPAYECTECGEIFLKSNGAGKGSMCPECGKMGSRLLDLAVACPHCDEIINLEEL